MNRYRIVFLSVLCTINICAQNIENDSIFKMFFKLREFENNTLLNYIYTEAEILGYYDRLCTSYYKLPFESSNYYKGIDISYRGIYADTIIHNRIIQLLKGNYNIGKIDSLNEKRLTNNKYSNTCDSVIFLHREVGRKDNENKISYRKFKQLLYACRYVDNLEIENLLIQMYRDEKFIDYKEDIYGYLLYKHIEPYTSIRLIKCMFNKRASYIEQKKCVNYLSLIATQKSYGLLADYLFSDKYGIVDVYYDASIECQHIHMKDTTIKNDYIFLDDLEDDDFVGVSEEKDYLWKDVVMTLLNNIENQDFLDLAKCKVTVSQLHYDDYDYVFSPKGISQMYNWMKKNYGKYKFRNRW